MILSLINELEARDLQESILIRLLVHNFPYGYQFRLKLRLLHAKIAKRRMQIPEHSEEFNHNMQLQIGGILKREYQIKFQMID
jgi:hypothetical protein